MADENKLVLITGASSGIGKATAKLFAQNGYNLILTYRQNQNGGEEVLRECQCLGAKNSVLFKLDLIDNQSIENFSKKVIEKFNKIDILINNAGKLINNSLIGQNFSEIELQLKSNLEGMIKLTKNFLPYIKESIVNIGSMVGFVGKKNLTVYCATKFGVRGFTKSLAKEYPDLRIYTVNPGLTATKMGSNEGLAPERVAQIIYNAATGQYWAKSGSDINVRDYLYGEFWKGFFAFKRTIKNYLRGEK